MRIAIDMDGTLMEFPEIYKALIEAFEAAGHEVWIVTGRKGETLVEDLALLASMGVLKDARHFINSMSFGEHERLLEEWSEKGQMSVDRDEIVCMWKARILVGFDLVIDDAADKIRLYMDGDKAEGVLLLKSPTMFNQVYAKWGRSHIMSYSEERKDA